MSVAGARVVEFGPNPAVPARDPPTGTDHALTVLPEEKSAIISERQSQRVLCATHCSAGTSTFSYVRPRMHLET